MVVNTNATATSVLTANAAAGTAQTFAGQIGGGTLATPANANLALTKAGPGTLSLTGTNTFAGSAAVAAGTLRVVGGGLNAARPYAVANGANLTVANTDPAAPLPATTLAAADGSRLTFELDAGTPGTAGLLAVTTADGTTLTGTVNVAVTTAGGALTVGQFALFSYAGALQGGGFAALNPSVNLPSRGIGSLVDNTANHSVDLNVTGVDFLRYTGRVNADFDIDTTANFALNSNGLATTYLDQPSPDTVRFDDTAAGSHTVNLTTTLRPAGITVDTATGYTFTGPGSLAGRTGLTKAGTGTLTIQTANAYTGTTAVTAGTVELGTGGTLGTGPVTVDAAGTLAVNRTDAVTIAGNIAGPGTVTTTGGGTTTLTGTNTIGTVAVPAGTLAVAGVTTLTAAATGPGPIDLPGGTLVVNDGVAVANPVTGTGNVTVLTGTGTLAGPFAYTGTSTASDGATLRFAADADNTLTGPLAGTGTIVKAGAGQLTLLAGGFGFTGTFVADAGTTQLNDVAGSGGDLGATSIVVNDGATFIFGPAGNVDFPETTFVTVNAGGTYRHMQSENFGGVFLNGGTYVAGNGNAASTTNADAAQGYNVSSGTFTTSGTGASQLSTASASTLLDKYTDGTVTFAGAVIVNPKVTINVHQGTLAFGGANVPTAGNDITLGDTGTAGTIRLTDATAATSARPIALQGNGGTFDLAVAGSSLTVTSAVTGSAPLTVAGLGTLTLTGANTYDGGTTVAGGTLRVNAAGATGTGRVTVATAGTLGGNGSTGAVTVNGTITAGPDATTIGTLTTAAQTWAAGGAFAVKADGIATDQLVMSGLTVPASGTFAVNVVGLNAAPVPVGTVFVLATDTEPQASNPFASDAVLSALTLTVNNVAVDGGGFVLGTRADAGGGYDLLLTAAAPEPTSLLLFASAVAPLVVGRRRRRR